jgi:hypothetical protein
MSGGADDELILVHIMKEFFYIETQKTTLERS